MWQQQYRQALVFYDSVLAVEPYFENIHYNMALAYYSLGEFPEAIDALAVTYRLYPTFGDGVYLLSESFLAMDDLRNAELWRSRLAATGFNEQRSKALHQSILLRARAKDTAPAAP